MPLNLSGFLIISAGLVKGFTSPLEPGLVQITKYHIHFFRFLMDILPRPLSLQISNTSLNVTKLVSYSCQLIYSNTKSNVFYIKQLVREQNRKHSLSFFFSLAASQPCLWSTQFREYIIFLQIPQVSAAQLLSLQNVQQEEAELAEG